MGIAAPYAIVLPFLNYHEANHLECALYLSVQTMPELCGGVLWAMEELHGLPPIQFIYSGMGIVDLYSTHSDLFDVLEIMTLRHILDWDLLHIAKVLLFAYGVYFVGMIILGLTIAAICLSFLKL